jgi:hypothetical protein
MTKSSWYKARGLVAVTAITVGWHMVWWRRFATGGHAIMARCTVIHDARVVRFGTDKGYGVMAHRAIFAICGKMGRCQASRSYTIVARRAIIGNTCMIKHRWHKGATGYMADIAIFTGCHMRWTGLGIFACCIGTIVAGITPFTHDVGAIMVDKCTEESSRVMAYGTITVGVEMNCCIRRSSGSY